MIQLSCGVFNKRSCHFKTSVSHQLCSLYIKLLEINPDCDNLHPGTAGMFPPHFLQDCYSLFASNIAQANPQIDWYNTPFFLFFTGMMPISLQLSIILLREMILFTSKLILDGTLSDHGAVCIISFLLLSSSIWLYSSTKWQATVWIKMEIDAL